MKNNSSLILDSQKYFKENGLFSIIIFIFAGLLVGAVALLNYFIPDLFILLVPLIILPIIFAFSISVIVMRTEPTLTFGMIFTGFRKYFSERFRSTFNVISTLLRALILYLIIAAILALAVNLSFYFTNFMNYQEFVAKLFSDMSQSDLESFINEYRELLVIIRMCTALPNLIITSFYVFYRFSIYSTSMFLRFSNFRGTGLYMLALYKRFLKKNRWKFFKDYLYLNWPMYLLLALGFAGGGLIGYFYFKDGDMMYTFGISIALFISFGVFGAKYFANKEALYKKYLPQIVEEDKKIKIDFIERLKAQFGDNIPEEYKQQFVDEEEANEENENNIEEP